MSNKDWRPPSLAQHFDAPDGYQGEFGWVCGFSADAAFMDDAAERFTRLPAAQRAHQGQIALALYLDPTNPQVRLQDAPGTAHLPLRDLGHKRFRLLHAKVALLGFRNREQPARWRLRLLVSTGNWTRQTLEESLDLTWCIEIAKEDLPLGDGVGQGCADIQAAWSLFQWLDTLFDTRLLEVGNDAGAKLARNRVKSWIDQCKPHVAGIARLFDNRKKSLFEEVKQRLSVSTVARNYLAMGSGFYEADTDDRAHSPGKIVKDLVPEKIVKDLIDKRILTKSADVDLFVNPYACQAIAKSVKRLERHAPSIVVRPAVAPEIVFKNAGSSRSLHAKFLFGANWREGSNVCSSTWIYLGSGNLTDAGFLQPASQTRGNLEVGVVFFPEEVYWERNRSVPEGGVVTNLLPILQTDFAENNGPKSGDEWIPPEAVFLSAPVSHLKWHQADGGGHLSAPDLGNVEIDVITPQGESCTRTEAGFFWPGSPPRSVSIRWKNNDKVSEAEVPVVDEYGRIAATILMTIDLEEAWWQLAEFPLPPQSELESEEDDSEGRGDAVKEPHTSGAVDTHRTPIRQMMQLIENIAARQTEVEKLDWILWCTRLEQTLGQAKESRTVKDFASLGLNPLSPLWIHHFRPSYAETGTTPEGALYEEILGRIESAWNVKDLPRIEGFP